MKTQVAIIGAGPAGTLLALVLKQRGIESIVIERQSKDYILGRIRAGVLEWTSVEILQAAGLGDRVAIWPSDSPTRASPRTTCAKTRWKSA